MLKKEAPNRTESALRIFEQAPALSEHVKPLAQVEHGEHDSQQDGQAPSHRRQFWICRPALAASTAPSMVRLLVSSTTVITMPLTMLGEK